VSRTMVRLHTPEAVELDRGPSPLDRSSRGSRRTATSLTR
jgi:hypothetical protein